LLCSVQPDFIRWL